MMHVYIQFIELFLALTLNKFIAVFVVVAFMHKLVDYKMKHIIHFLVTSIEEAI